MIAALCVAALAGLSFYSAFLNVWPDETSDTDAASVMALVGVILTIVDLFMWGII